MICPVACWISVPRTRLMKEMTFRGIAFSVLLLDPCFCMLGIVLQGSNLGFRLRLVWDLGVLGSGKPLPRCWGYFWLFQQPGEHHMVAKISLHGQPWQNNWICVFVHFLWGLWERCPLWVLYDCSTHSIVSTPEHGHCVYLTVPLLHGQFLQQRGQPRDKFAR